MAVKLIVIDKDGNQRDAEFDRSRSTPIRTLEDMERLEQLRFETGFGYSEHDPIQKETK